MYGSFSSQWFVPLLLPALDLKSGRRCPQITVTPSQSKSSGARISWHGADDGPHPISRIFSFYDGRQEPSHIDDDSGVEQNQDFDMGNNDELPVDKEVSKANWFKKPVRPPTPDLD
ncbi:hypothetical protein Tco_0866975 [Tanacetum coccineum]